MACTHRKENSLRGEEPRGAGLSLHLRRSPCAGTRGCLVAGRWACGARLRAKPSHVQKRLRDVLGLGQKSFPGECTRTIGPSFGLRRYFNFTKTKTSSGDWTFRFLLQDPPPAHPGRWDDAK